MANKSIQMQDGSDYIFPRSIAYQDISNQFTYALSSGEGLIRVLYDPVNKIVKGFFSVNGANAFNTTTAMFTIPSAYRPSANVLWTGMIKTSSDVWGAYNGAVLANGNIVQKYSASATQATGTFEYQI